MLELGLRDPGNLKVARSDFWVVIPFNFEWLELHHYQSNRKSNLSAVHVLEKYESFKLVHFTKIWVTIATKWRHASFHIRPNNLPPEKISEIRRQDLGLDIVASVPDRWRVSGQKPDKISCMTRQINGKCIIIWWDQWELARWNSLLAHCLKNLFGTLSCLNDGKIVTKSIGAFSRKLRVNFQGVKIQQKQSCFKC